MPIKFTIILKKFYRETFNPSEDEINFDSFTKFTLLFFRMSLFDFKCLDENANFKTKAKYYGKKFFNVLAIISCLAAALQIITFGIVNSGNFDILIRAFSDAATYISISLNGFILFLQKDKIRIILDELKNLFQSRNKDFNEDSLKMKGYLDAYNRVMNFFAAITIIANLSVGSFWFPYLINGSVYYATNLWFPFVENNKATFPFIQLWIQWTIYLAVSFLLVPTSLLFVIVTIITMELDSLTKDLKFFKLKKKEELAHKMAYITDRHNNLFDVYEKLKIIFEPILFCNFLISSLIMCIVSFQLLTTASDCLTYFVDINYLATFASQIWLLCTFGQKLIDSSSAVADETYNCDWTDLDNNKFKKQMIIIMIRAQRPIKLTAMGFADISLETFAAVKIFVTCRFKLFN